MVRGQVIGFFLPSFGCIACFSLFSLYFFLLLRWCCLLFLITGIVRWKLGDFDFYNMNLHAVHWFCRLGKVLILLIVWLRCDDVSVFVVWRVCAICSGISCFCASATWFAFEFWQFVAFFKAFIYWLRYDLFLYSVHEESWEKRYTYILIHFMVARWNVTFKVH